MNERTSPHRAALARDAALARLRRLTRGTVAATVGLTGIFVALAAGSTHPRKVVSHVVARRTRTTARQTPTVQAQPATTSDDGETESTPVPAQTAPATPAQTVPAAPAQAPAPATSPPVVVTGGS